MNANSTPAIFKSIILFLVLGAMNAPVTAHPAESDEYFTHHRASITGALTSSDTWQVQLSYHYMFWNYFGIGGSIGSWKNYFDNGYASGTNWSIDDDDNEPWNIYVRPSIVLKSPAIKIRDVALSAYVEPGMMLNVPYARVCIESTPNWPATDYDYISTTKGQWFAMDVHLGVNADIGPIGISAGYLMSNLDIYSQYRHLSYKGISFKDFYPRKPFMQGAYMTLSYNF